MRLFPLIGRSLELFSTQARVKGMENGGGSFGSGHDWFAFGSNTDYILKLAAGEYGVASLNHLAPCSHALQFTKY